MTPAPAAPAATAQPKRYIPWLTVALMAANCAVFLLEYVRVLASTLPPLTRTPVWIEPGVLHGLALWLDHEWWRAVTAMFLHANAIHLIVNMWALWNVGSFTERLFGRPFMLFAYFLTGVSGSFLSVLAHPTVNGVGSSGAIFGLFGLICGFALRARQLIAPEAFQQLRTGILLSLGLNVALTVAIPGIDVAAHAGGLLAGTGAGLLATASAIESPTRRPAFSSQLIVIASVIGLALISRVHTVNSLEGKSWERNRVAREAFRRGEWDEVVAAATHALDGKDDWTTRMMRAEAYGELHRWPEALADLTAAQGLTSLDSPSLPDVLEMKANAELHVGKTDEAKSDLARATDLAGGDASWIELQGQLSVYRGDYELAVLELRAAHKRLPEEPSPANSLAWALVMIQGDMDEALAAANVAVEKAKKPVPLPGDSMMAASLGTRCWVHALRDDKERAMADCQAAIESGSKYVDQGMLAYLKGDYKEAITQWQHAGEDSELEAREMKPWIERAKSKL